jgi:hypothetical protein
MEKSLRSQNDAFNKDIARHNQLRQDLRFSSFKVGPWTYLVLSLILSMPQGLEHPLVVPETRLLWHSTLADFTIEWEIMPHDGNIQKSFAALPLKPNDPIKHGCVRPNHIRSSNFQTWSVQWSSPAEPSETWHSRRIHDPYMESRKVRYHQYNPISMRMDFFNSGYLYLPLNFEFKFFTKN